MKELVHDLKNFFIQMREQDFAFWMVCGYLIFSYLRPQVTFPQIGFLPWTQLTILAGLFFLVLKGQVRFQSVHFYLVLFFLIITVSAVNSVYPEISLTHLDAIYIWVIEVLLVTSCVRNLQQFKIIMILFFLIMFKMSLFGAKTWVMRGFSFTSWGIAGPEGFFANSGEFSLLMAMVAIMSIAYLSGCKKVNKLYYLLPITAVMTVLAASSRGGQLALACGGLIIAVVIGKLKMKNILKVALIGFLAYSVLPAEQKDRFTSAGDDNTSESRLTYWEAGLEMLDQHKLLGVGHYAFPQYFHDHYSHWMPQDTFLSSRKETAHNTFIQVASTTGYIGFFCYMWLLYMSYSLNNKTRKLLKLFDSGYEEVLFIRRVSIGLDAALIAYIVGAMFMSVAFYPYTYLLLMLSLSLHNCVVKLVPSPIAKR